MAEQRVNLTDRLEWLFPLRGRWLRRFLAGIAWVLGLLFALHCYGLRDALPTLAQADPKFIDLTLEKGWGWGAYGGFSLAGHTSYDLHLGPLHLSWLAPDFGFSWGSWLISAFMDLMGIGVLLFVGSRLARGMERMFRLEELEA